MLRFTRTGKDLLVVVVCCSLSVSLTGLGAMRGATGRLLWPFKPCHRIHVPLFLTSLLSTPSISPRSNNQGLTEEPETPGTPLERRCQISIS